MRLPTAGAAGVIELEIMVDAHEPRAAVVVADRYSQDFPRIGYVPRSSPTAWPGAG